jgi:alpha-glucosidase (family GH31 glycosyl hydrolase)
VIRHRPLGLGHPYRLEPDQRVPAQPLADAPFQLRATSDRAVERLELEAIVGHERQLLSAQLDSSEAASESGGSLTHLSAAAAGGCAGKRRRWVAALGPFPAGEHVRYRFRGVGARGDERTRWHEVTTASWQREGGRLELRPSEFADRLVLESVAWLVADQGPLRARFALRLADEEHVVGFGERFDALDQRGRRLDAVVFEQYKAQGARTYLPMPFAIVSGGEGWGFHVETGSRTWFDVGATRADQLAIEVELDPRHRSPTLALRLFSGAPAEVLSSFLRATGQAPLPPPWAFRPWISSNEWNTQERVLAEVERSHELGIPVGVVVIEAWSDESTFYIFRDAIYAPREEGEAPQLADFTFPRDGAWPDPRALVDALHARGIRVLLWQIPLQKMRPPPRGQARADAELMIRNDYVVKTDTGRPYRNRGWWFPGALLPDFTSTAARNWWLGKRRYLVSELGIDGFKTDGGEHAWGGDLRYADGTSGTESNNLYPVRYAAAYHSLFHDSGRAGVTFSRAGFTGAAAYPCHWAGDEDSTWEAFRASITAGLTAGACGVFFWGWDLAGFSGEVPSAELYLRAAAMACFCPIMQYHSEFNHHRRPSRDRTPWNIAKRSGDARVVPIFRRYARLRERLLPYIVQQAERSLASGLPLMRALLFEAPTDPAIWDFPHQYLFGDEMLISPVTVPGATSWQAYLPPGEWVDAWTREHLSGGSIISRPTALDEIPAYIKDSAPDWLLDVFSVAELDGTPRRVRACARPA